MARTPRGRVVERDEVGAYHCISRCVRRAFLCGQDAVTGRSFEHRRQWIQDRMEFLAGVFGIDVLAFAVMSNHLHVVLRNRPDVVRGWSDEDVARRWWRLFPLRRDEHGQPAEMEPHDLAQLLTRTEVLRERLADVSWWMRCLAEGIARRANREDQCTGRFWEGRFKCQPLLDESAIAACMAYVDLNVVRAGLAPTPETSRFTSIYERLSRASGRTEPTSETSAETSTDASAASEPEPCPTSAGGAEWLSPIELAHEVSAETERPGSDRRASHRGCLPMTLAEYAQLLDWTGRQLRRDKPGRIPADLPPLLERLHTSGDHWLLMVRHFRSLFRTAAGRPKRLQDEATRRSRRWLHGTSASRHFFG